MECPVLDNFYISILSVDNFLSPAGTFQLTKCGVLVASSGKKAKRDSRTKRNSDIVSDKCAA